MSHIRINRAPRPVAIGPMPLPRPRRLKAGPRPYAVRFEGGPWAGQSMRLRASSGILPIRVRGGIYLPSGRFSAFGSAA